MCGMGVWFVGVWCIGVCVLRWCPLVWICRGMAYKSWYGYKGTPAKVFPLKEFPWSCGAVRRSGVVMPCYTDVISVLG